MHVPGQKIPSLINHCGCRRHVDGIVTGQFDSSEISTTVTLYLGFLLQTKARWTLIRLVCLVRAQIDILHGDENVCLEVGSHHVVKQIVYSLSSLILCCY